MGFVSHPLPPIVDESSQILILGSFPSLKSFEEMFYYAHPKNQFWRLLGDIYGVCVNTKEEKIRLLRNSKIALWDVVAACERVNSSDSNLKIQSQTRYRIYLGDSRISKKCFLPDGRQSVFIKSISPICS